MLNVLLGALFSFPVNLSLSLCFSGHVICSLAALLFLLLTPLRTLTSCRPHVDLWPTSLSLSFFLRLVVHFLYFCALENPTFLSVRSVTDTPHTDCVLSTHWEGGGDPRSLSLFLSVTITLFYIPLPLSLPLFSIFPTLSFPSFPIPFPPALLPVCMCMRLTFIAHLPLCLHGDTGTRGRSNTGLLEMTSQTLHWHLMLLDQQTRVRAWHAYWEWPYSLSRPPQWSVPRGVKKATDLFLWTVTCVCSVHVWMLWLFCMSLIFCKRSIWWVILCEICF